tara:strand:- start:129 stop:422 length:294 start_codon:yes stop_codon:yes gene_type:complete
MMSRFEKFDKWLGTNKGARVRFIVLLTICTLGLLYHLVGCNRLEQEKTAAEIADQEWDKAEMIDVRYYVEPSNEQKCLFEGTYEECEKFIEILNQNK